MEPSFWDREEWKGELDQAPLLKQWTGQADLSVPEDYFSTLSQSIRERIEEEELLHQSPLLTESGNANIFTTPLGYFDRLPQRIKATIKDSQGYIIPFWSRRSTLFSAVAASITLLISILGVSNQITSLIDPVDQAVAIVDKLSPEEMIMVMHMDAESTEDIIALLDQEALGEELDLPDSEDLWLEDMDAEDIEDIMLYDM